MNLKDLEYLVALAEEGHFGRAAERCSVSQPTLSGQLKKLEQALQVSFLERTSRRVLFTQAGLQLVAQARRVLAEARLFRELAGSHGETMSGPLHLGLIPTVAPYLLPHMVPGLRQAFPRLELYLHEAQTQALLTQLQGGQLDCAILALLRETGDFIELPLYDEPMQLAVPVGHEWQARQQVALGELAGHRLLMLEDGHCLREQALGYCFAAGAAEDRHFRATSLETLRNMVAAGAGITLLPQLAVPGERCRDGVCYLPCREPQPSRRIGLIYRPGSPLRGRYEQLADHIRGLMAPLCPLMERSVTASVK